MRLGNRQIASARIHSINRGKKSLGLNLKTSQGKEILWQLLDRADVVLENFRPGVLANLGFGYEAVKRRNPRVIYCSISGFGQTGPYRDRAGYDVVAQGEAGLYNQSRDNKNNSKGVGGAHRVSPGIEVG